MKIAVVDDHELVAEGIASILKYNKEYEVEKFNNASSIIEVTDAGKEYDIYIIDLELPDMDGFVLIETIREHNPEAKVVVNTVHDELWTLRKLLSAGVNAIIYKSCKRDEILTAINEIIKGNNYYCEAVMNAMKEVNDASNFPTSRELDVLYRIAQGKTTREIAADLFVSDNTVEAHRKSLFQKLDAVNMVDLVVKAIAKGYIKTSGSIR